MSSFRCTQAVLKDLGIKPSNNEDPNPPAGYFGDFYVHLVSIQRRKVLVFTSADTLYTFLVAGISKAERRNLHPVFLSNLRTALTADGVHEHVIEQVLGEYKQSTIKKAENRRVVGSMNDMIETIRFEVEYRRGWDACGLQNLNRMLNETPYKFIGYKCPMDFLNERLRASVLTPHRSIPVDRICIN